MGVISYKYIETQDLCQDYVRGYKAIDSEIVAFYIKDRNDLRLIKDNNTSGIYKRLIGSFGVYFLFKTDENSDKMKVYTGRTRIGIKRCCQHLDKENNADINMYNDWEHVIYFTGDEKDWSVDAIYDIEKIFIAYFKANHNKYILINKKPGDSGRSNPEDINVKISAMIAFLKEKRFGFNFDYNNNSEDIIIESLRESAKSALEIKHEAEQEFKNTLINNYNQEFLNGIDFYKRAKHYFDFRNLITNASDYIIGGRIYKKGKDIRELDVITPIKVANININEIPIKYLDGLHSICDLATKSGSFICAFIDKLMSDDSNLPINNADMLRLDWNKNKLSRLKHIIKNLVYGMAVSQEAYLVTNESIFKLVDKYIKDMNYTGWILDSFAEIPNIKYNSKYMSVIRSKGKNKSYLLKKIMEEEFEVDMKFDIIVGNPPYQEGTKSIYNEFMELSMELKPKFITMIVRNNWLASDTMKETRDKIINFGLVKVINYPIVGEIFESAGVGVCIFSAEYEYKKETNIVEVRKGETVNNCNVNLIDTPAIFMSEIEYNVVNKVKQKTTEWFNSEVYPQEAFRITSAMGAGRGENSYLLDYSKERTDEYNVGVLCMDGSKLYYNYIKREDVPNRVELVDKYKIVACARLNNNNNPITSIKAIKANDICSSTFAPLFVSDDPNVALNAYKYIRTKFFRYMVKLLCTSGITNHSESRFRLVPMQDFSKPWTDQELYERYEFNTEEIKSIEMSIKSLE